MIDFLKEVSASIYHVLGSDFLVSFFIKSSVIILSALIIHQLLKNQASSLRYSILNISLITLLVIPFVPDIGQPVEVSLYEYETFGARPASLKADSKKVASVIQTIEKDELSISENPVLSLLETTAIIWLLGIGLLTAFLLREIIWLRMLLFTTSKPTAEIASALQTCRERICLSRKIKVTFHSRIDTPITFGSLLPIIVLPESAKEWEPEKVKIVLLHELIHIKRNDYLTNLIASLGVIICWYNPLAWVALKRQKAECEKACDERVLANNINPSRYATELLRLSQESGVSEKLKLNSTVSILGATSVKDRIKHILEGPRRKRALSLYLAVGLTLGVLFEAFSISSIQFYSEKTETTKMTAITAIDSDPIQFVNDADVQIRRKAAKSLIADYNPRILRPIFKQLSIETDPEVKSSLIASIAKFEDSKEFYAVAKHINSDNLHVKLQVLEYMQVISCFPSYLVVEASVHDQNPEISAAARTHLQNFDRDKLKRSIRNFANNFRYNNNLSMSIGEKMSWMHGYKTIDDLSKILKSRDATKKRVLGDRLLTAASNEEFTALKEIINNSK